MQGVTIVLAFLIKSTWSRPADDPCTTAKPFTDLEQRSPRYQLRIGDEPLSDRYVAEGWYGQDGFGIPVVSPGPFYCGSRYPVYLKEKVPETGEVENVTVCVDTIFNKCSPTFEMEVMNCNSTFNVYHLIRLPLSESAYCAGPALPGDHESAEFKTKVDVEVSFVENNITTLVFYCNFEPSIDPPLWYIVTWYVNDILIRVTRPVQELSALKDSTKLEESTLLDKGITSVGFYVKCGVSANPTMTSVVGLPFISKAKFVGIEILTPSIHLHEGQVAEILVRPTAAIGCFHFPGLPFDCSLDVNIIHPLDPSDSCKPRAKFTDCKLGISSNNWNQTYSMPVKVVSPPVYGSDVVVNVVKLKTVNIFPSHSIWQHSEVGEVQIHIHKDTSSIEAKRCYAVCDPHMMTFQQTKYGHHFPGIFTLYENQEWNQEIQFQTSPCYEKNAYCICGAAIRSGREVFIMNRCGFRRYWAIDYAMCDDTASLLDVEKNGMDYKIKFPSGTIVEIQIARGVFLNIYVYPSRRDVNVAQGLCGSLTDRDDDDDGDDSVTSEFVNRGGEATEDEKEFSLSWEVQDDIINLFDREDIQDLIPSTTELSYCTCDVIKDGSNALSCNKGCKSIVEYSPVKSCRVRDKRKERSTSHMMLFSQPSDYHHDSRNRRSIPEKWRNGWSFESAKQYCSDLIDNTTVLQICKTIPRIDMKSPLSNCILDIKYMGDTSFAMVAVETIKNQCYHEVSSNKTLQRSHTNTPSVFDQVKVVACPNECSFHGDCILGKCDCEINHGGVDCSVDISEPPLLVHLSDDGYCDLAESSCSEVSVYGGSFVQTSKSSCKIHIVQIAENGTKEELDETVQANHVESLGEVTCVLPRLRLRRTLHKPEMELINVYRISVSNDGANYSNEKVLVIYNSRCQHCLLSEDVTCSYDGDYCMSDGVCYENGQPHSVQRCYTCNVNSSSRSWTYSKDPRCRTEANVSSEAQKTIEDDTLLWIVGASVASFALISITALVIMCCIRNKNKKESNNDQTIHYRSARHNRTSRR